MTFVLNKCYGGWSLSQFAMEKLGLNTPYPFLTDDLVDNVIALIKAYGSDLISGTHARLKIVEIPDNCTDYEINEYDGIETITYVVDGKIHHA